MKKGHATRETIDQLVYYLFNKGRALPTNIMGHTSIRTMIYKLVSLTFSIKNISIIFPLEKPYCKPFFIEKNPKAYESIKGNKLPI